MKKSSDIQIKALEFGAGCNSLLHLSLSFSHVKLDVMFHLFSRGMGLCSHSPMRYQCVPQKRMPSSGMLLRVALVRIDVSE
jgi:hypothetical protein